MLIVYSYISCDVCPDILTKGWRHTKNIMHVYWWGCVVVQVMHHAPWHHQWCHSETLNTALHFHVCKRLRYGLWNSLMGTVAMFEPLCVRIVKSVHLRADIFVTNSFNPLKLMWKHSTVSDFAISWEIGKSRFTGYFMTSWTISSK